MVEDLVLVEEAAERDDDVLTGDVLWELALELYAGHWGNLPPGLAGGPDGGGVCTHDGGTEGTNTTVGVGVRVRRNGEVQWEGVSLLDHDLVADTPSGGVEVDAVLLGEVFDVPVLGEVLLGLVLDVVV